MHAFLGEDFLRERQRVVRLIVKMPGLPGVLVNMLTLEGTEKIEQGVQSNVSLTALLVDLEGFSARTSVPPNVDSVRGSAS